MDRTVRRTARGRRATALVAAVAVLVISVAAVAVASIPDSSGVVRACFKTAGGALRVIDTSAGSTCTAGERALAWPVTPKRTRLHFTTIEVTTPPADATYTLGRTVGVVSKQRAGTVLRLTWVGQVTVITNPGACNFQLRVDGKTDNGSAATAFTPGSGGSANVVMGAPDGDVLPVSVTAWFNGLAAGTHTVQIWVRGLDFGSGQPECVENAGGYGQDVLVEETS